MTELFFETPTPYIISVYTTSSAKVGTHQVTVTLGLVNYPSIMKPLPSFTLTIDPCIVTSVNVLSSGGGVLTAQTYTLSGSFQLNYQLQA